MIWLVDIDGCLCDNREAFITRCSTWLDNNMIVHSEPKRDEYDFGKVFGVDDSLAIPCFESEEFAGYYIEEPAVGAVEFLQSIDTNEDMIVILTGRNPDDRVPITEELHNFLGSRYDSRHTISVGVLTKLWLAKHKVPHHNTIYRKDKVSFVKEFESVITIEDDPKIIEGYFDNNIKCVAMRAEYNDGLTGLFADNWSDIARMHRVGII